MQVMPEADILVDRITEEQGKKRFGESQYKLLAGHGGACPASHVPTLMNAMLTGEPYPVKMLMCFGNNGIISFADSQKVRRAYESVDFISCMDLFMTPTCELADVVLPAASWLELDEVYSGPALADHAILTMRQVTRIGECRSDEEVLADLANRLGLDYAARTPYDIYNEQLRAVGEKYSEYKDLDWDKMKELSYLEFPIEYKKYEKRGRLSTPSGKMELYSSAMAELGLDPLPDFKEPPESPYSTPEIYKDYPLVLTTGGRDKFYFISEGRQIPMLRKMSKYPMVEMHPETAEKYGIKDGDWVWIETRRGKITQKAKVHDGIDPRVINCAMGWWYPEEKNDTGHGWNESNCNVLTSQDPPYDPNSGTYQLRGLLCRISRNDDCHIEERLEKSGII
jgi:anaerobic selenocysteine-containing dehydrogenase